MSTLLDVPPAPSRISGRRPKRLLLVAYNFPPVGGAGVQRPVKWVKHLRRFGWDVSVLTTENPSVPARDESLLADIPQDVVVARARTWEPDYRTKQGLATQGLAAQGATGSRGVVARCRSLVGRCIKGAVKLALQPDPQVLWVPDAIKVGRRLLEEMEHDAILVTAPAYSSFFIGTALKRRFGLPLVLDYRDEWDMSGKYLENAPRDLISQFVQERMQRRLLRQADAVVATTRASTSKLAERLKAVNRPKTPVTTIYNGYDDQDFSALEDAARNSDTYQAKDAAPRFRLVYAGTLWNLTTIEPLVTAVRELFQSRPDVCARLELVCVGRKTPEQRAILERLNQTNCELQLVDYCDHSRVLEWLQSAHAVCLLLSDVPGAERVVPAKLFECLASRKDLLAIVPAGETAQIVDRFYPDSAIQPQQIGQIRNWLEQRLAQPCPSGRTIDTTPEISEFSRVTQTGYLADVLNALPGIQQSPGRVEQ